MNKITINYSISRTVALTEGRAEFGQATYQPTDTELQLLTLEDRKYLDTLNLDRSIFELPTGVPPTWPNIVDSIKADHQKKLDSKVAELAEREAKIREALAQPDDKWIISSTHWNCGVNEKSVRAEAPVWEVRGSYWGSNDERIKARFASLKPEVDRLLAIAKEKNDQAEARHNEAEQRKEQQKAETEAAREAAVTNLTEWCVASGPIHLQRAAKEGYSVVGGCAQWITEQLKASVGGTIIRDNTKIWGLYDWNERKSPGLKAFELLDTVTAAVTTLNKPSSVTVEVDRIMLVELESEDDGYETKREFTAVIVNVKHLAAARRCLVIEVE